MHESIEEDSGEAWLGEPVMLSWEDSSVREEMLGYNVVVQEFAHKLRMANAVDDGVPMLDQRFHSELSRTRFSVALLNGFAQYNLVVSKINEEAVPDQALALDPYAAEHPEKFFAVSAE